MSRSLRRVVPRPVRRIAARASAEAALRRTQRTLIRLARSNAPILAGPWLGEVGFELLYWVPFLRWAVEGCGVDPSRIVVVSRGGPESWYRGIGARYRDVLDYLSPEEIRAEHDRRRREAGQQKQVDRSAFDSRLLERVGADLGEPRPAILHPSLMYRAMQPYWWRHVTAAWVDRVTRFRRLPAPDLDAVTASLPEDYVAVKFYFNDCFPATPASRAFITAALATLTGRTRVVVLSSGVQIDDHAEYDGAIGLGSVTRSLATPSTNLAVQTAVVARARAFVGTYGGFSYLAPLLGVPATAVWADRAGFDANHLAVIERVLARGGLGTLAVSAIDRPADAVLAGVGVDA